MNKTIKTKPLTHMPFLYKDDNDTILLLCIAEKEHMWKLHYSINDRDPVRINTTLPTETIECAPTAWKDSEGWHVSFIAGNILTNQPYYLYLLEGPSLDKLSQPKKICSTRTGFVFKDRTVWGEMGNTIHLIDNNKERDIKLPDAWLYRISYKPDNPEQLLISGGWMKKPAGNVFSILYDTDTDKQEILTCKGKPAYKCAILGNQILYTDQTDKHFEHRKLRETNKLSCKKIKNICKQEIKHTGDNKRLLRDTAVQGIVLNKCSGCEALVNNKCAIVERSIQTVYKCPVGKW